MATKIAQAVNRFGQDAVGDFLDNHTSPDRSTLINDPDVPSGNIEFTENTSSAVDVSSYATATVNVPQPSGKITITENGTDIDVSSYATADVDVEQGVFVDTDYTIESGKLTSASVELDGEVVVTIPDGVTEIGNRAFLENTLVNKIIIPNTVVSIDDGYSTYETVGAFAKCTNLNEIILPNNSSFVNLPACFVCRCTSLTSIIIPDSITSIGGFAFAYCSSLTSIVIPNGVASIGESAFGRCTSLSNITIPESITSIGSNVFGSCTSLTSVVIPNNVTSIGESAFANCTSLSSVNIPDGITDIDVNTFYNCSSLNSIVIPNSVTSIGNGAFYGCSSLTDIYYTGTQAEWEQISNLINANIPQDCTIHYEYTPSEETQETPEENPETPAE